jgi:3-hydroxyisobutyrate dehydrogenase
MPTSPATPIALLGTGHLGSAFAEAFLARGGSELTVWNRTKSKAEPLAALGARVADSPADAVRDAERVHLVLLDDDTVDETILAMRPGLRDGVVIVDHTTLRPDRTAARAAALDAAGLEYLHAPVMMGPPAARSAKGLMFVAGPTERFERVKHALTTMTGELVFLGERADLAAAYKLCANGMMLMMAGSMADVFHMADAMEMPRTDVLNMYNRVTSLSSVIGIRAPRVVAEDFNATFTLDVARKDVRLMIESSGSENVPILRALAQRMDDVIAAGNAHLDVGVLSKKGL